MSWLVRDVVENVKVYTQVESSRLKCNEVDENTFSYHRCKTKAHKQHRELQLEYA